MPFSSVDDAATTVPACESTIDTPGSGVPPLVTAPVTTHGGAAGREDAVPLFNKLRAGQWEFLGLWRVAEGNYVYDESQRRMVWKFTLRKA